ncbi:hypothetical protein JCM10207_008526 [Rhodosporidiobolus poonsookiae]
MAVDGIQDCAVCTRKAMTRCSGCHELPLCSRTCGKIFWRWHKLQCKSNDRAFVFPPMTPREAASIRVMERAPSGLPGVPRGKTLLQLLRDCGLYGGDWDGLMAQLVQDVPYSKRRGQLLSLAYTCLHINLKQSPGLDDTVQQSPWHGTSPMAATLITPSLFGGKSALAREGEPLEVCKTFLTHTLVAHALLHHYSDQKVGDPELLKWAQAAYGRALSELKTLPLSTEVRHSLEEYVNMCAMVINMLAAGVRNGTL